MAKHLPRASRRTLRNGAVACLLVVTAGCAADFAELAGGDFTDDNGTGTDELTPEERAKASFAAKVLFRADTFTINVATGASDCGGDARVYNDLYPVDSDGNPVDAYLSSVGTYYPLSFAQATRSTITQTAKPDWLKNVSVDLSDMNVEHDSNEGYETCSRQDSEGAPYPSACARFDMLSRAVTTWYPEYIETGTDMYLYSDWGSATGGSYPYPRYGGVNGTMFYTFLDYECIDAGPVHSSLSPEESRKNAGGIDIDIDRQALGASENLLLHLTYIPFGMDTATNATDAASEIYGDAVGSTYLANQVAFFKIMLLSMGNPSVSLIQAMTQPRNLSNSYYTRPKVVSQLAVLSNPDGWIKEEQFVIPLSLDTEIDRIRIERESGSGILVSASLYRMGPK